MVFSEQGWSSSLVVSVKPAVGADVLSCCYGIIPQEDISLKVSVILTLSHHSKTRTKCAWPFGETVRQATQVSRVNSFLEFLGV